MDCDFDNKRLICPRCRTRAPSRDCRRNCTGWPLAHELGHWLRWLLAAIGVTPARYARWRGRYRVVGGMHCVLVELPPDEPGCNCAARREWLNRWGQSLVNRWWP
jgi:hypothetical protein